MIGISHFAHFGRLSLMRLADWAAVAVAVALPWSTTAVGIAIAVWLVVLLPSLDAASLKRELTTAAGGFPIVLWCLGAIGMLWADVGWHDRLAGLDSFHRLLGIPLLLAQFRRSANGIWIVRGFFISSIFLLVTSYMIAFAFADRWHGIYGVPVHDTIFQGSVFLICGLGAIGYAALARGKQSWRGMTAIFAIGVLFLVSFAVVTTSRVALVVAPILLVLLGWRLLYWRGAATAVLLVAVAGGAMWFASPVLRDRVGKSIVEMQQYRAVNKATSIGEHIAFLEESLSIIASA